MNHTTSAPFRSPASHGEGPVAPPAAGIAPSTLDAMQSRFGLRVAARLTEHGAALDPDVAERLRFSREKALERARAVRQAGAVAPLGVTRGGAALLGRGGWWVRMAPIFPALVLAAGLFMIQRSQENAQISSAAEVDTALLADDLPPQAYSDAGFAEFLKSSNE